MNQEVYVIQTIKGILKRYPIDKRNRFIKEKEIFTTTDFLETYHYEDKQAALIDLADFGFNPKEYEVKKYSFTYQEVEE